MKSQDKNKVSIFSFLDSQARMKPNETAFVLLGKGYEIIDTITYKELYLQSSRIASYLDRNAKSNIVIQLFDQSINGVKAFWGCLQCGKIPFPVYYNSGKDIKNDLRNILEMTQAKCIVSDSKIIHELTKASAFSNLTDVFAVEDILSSTPDIEFKEKINSNDIACILSSSGTTGVPKGVVITNRNVFCNMERATDVFCYSQDSRILTWSPIQHVLGLTIHMMMGIYKGIPVYLIPSVLFMEDTHYFLTLIPKYQITHLGFSNFAFKLLVETQHENKNYRYDLSTLKSITCGGELVHHNDLNNFIECFKPYQLNPASIIPAYGMTETCGVISGYKSTENSYKTIDKTPHGSIIVSNGCVKDRTKIKIVDGKSGLDCKEGEIGYIHIAGDILSPGYLSPEMIQKIEKDEKYVSFNYATHEWLNSGDLGFIQDGELYIVGREKDILIIRGRKYNLVEIERIVRQEFTNKIPASVAIAASINSEEKLVLLLEAIGCVLESDEQKAILKDDIRSCLIKSKGISPYEIIFLEHNSLPRTNLGKISRSDSVKLYQKITSSKVCENETVSEDENYVILTQKITELVDTNDVLDFHNKSLIAMGFDSLSLARFCSFVNTTFGTSYIISDFFQNGFTLKTLLSQLKGKTVLREQETNVPLIPEEQNEITQTELTDIQHSYWISQQGKYTLSGNSALIYVEIECLDEIKVDKLTEALRKLVQRHPLLLSAVSEDGYLVIQQDSQLINEIPVFPICDFDKIRQEYSTTNFDLAQAPLFRVCLSEASDKHIIHFCISLLIADASSIQLLMRDWFLLYHERENELPPLKTNFASYVHELSKRKESPDYLRAKEYYQQSIGSIHKAHELYTLQDPALIKSSSIVHQEHLFDRETSERLKKIAQEMNVTSTTLFLAFFCRALSLWSKSPAFSIILTVDGRAFCDQIYNDIVGDFTSTQILSLNCNGLKIDELISSIQDRISKNLDYHQFNGVEISRMISSSGNLTPIVFTNAIKSSEKYQSGNYAYSWGKRTYSYSQTPQVWLDCQIFEDNGHLILAWDYIKEIFPCKMMSDMFAYLLSEITQLTNDNLKETDSSFTLPHGQHILRLEYNSTSEEVTPQMLFSGFLNNVQKKPGNIAIVHNDRLITYQELHNAVITLVRIMEEKGITSQTRVGIYSYKGWEQVAAALAIQIVGCAYVSVDPDLPLVRREFILNDSNIALVISSEKLSKEIEGNGRIVVACKSDYLAENQSDILSKYYQDVKSPAYLIYTSGSTGTPKGVVITHESAYNTIWDINRKFTITEKDRVLALSSLSFDLSVYDIFGLLDAGGSIVIPDHTQLKNPDHWRSLIDKYHVTVWNSVPALMEMFTFYLGSEMYESTLRLCLLSGDWIPVTLPDLLRKLFVRPLEIISLGGATEASIWSIYYPVDQVEKHWKSIPYGMPLANQQMYVLNDKLEDCPEYVTGNIYIGGIGLAREYWNNEEKTNQAFIEHPIKKCRLYRTGDLGRFMPDGYIEFLGREDHQVKIGGFRIEIGEIESVLNKHELVNRAIVVKKKDSTGSEKLECFIVPAYPIEHLPGNDLGIITDKEERKKFKLSLQGIRRSALGKTNIDLNQSQNGYYQNYVMRASSRRFLDASIDLTLLGEFLSCMSIWEHNGSLRRRYASAGSSYPVQVYLCQHKKRINGLENNVLYYYNPLSHSLNKVADHFPVLTDFHENENKEIYDEEGFSVFLIANLNAIEPLYGKKALEFCLIEVGLMTQVMETTGVNTGIGICQIGSYKNYDFIKNFNLPDENYRLIHSFIAGKIDFTDNARSLPRHEDESSQDYGKEDTIAILKAYVLNELPNYMCPSNWHILSDVPLTSNGKVDYSAILNYGEKETVSGTVQPSPQPSVQQEVSFKNLVVDEVSQILGTKDIDLDANFFEIGIDSKTIVKIWRGITDKSKIKFPLTSIFEHTTVLKLARYLEIQRIN